MLDRATGATVDCCWFPQRSDFLKSTDASLSRRVTVDPVEISHLGRVWLIAGLAFVRASKLLGRDGLAGKRPGRCRGGCEREAQQIAAMNIQPVTYLHSGALPEVGSKANTRCLKHTGQALRQQHPNGFRPCAACCAAETNSWSALQEVARRGLFLGRTT
jgi:hypothetical protein